jgi:hypothetical protein
MRKNLFSKWSIALTALIFIFALAVAALGEDTARPQEQPKPAETLKKMEGPKGLLDGKYFVGQIGQEGKTTGKQEAIAFRHGTFHSSAYDSNGFASAPYTATEDGGVIKFNVTCTSPKNGKMEWSGTVKGEELDATAKMIQEGKDPVNMWAKGTAAKMEHMEHKGGKMPKNSGEPKKAGSK